MGSSVYPCGFWREKFTINAFQKLEKKKVALITGEEKLIPSNADFFICTVESMPKDKKVDFVAVDEIQMCCDKERGHIFTDRFFILEEKN